MESPLFYPNEPIICIDSKGEFDTDEPLDLIQGKKYTVNDPSGRGITLIGHGGNRYDQNRFIPEQTDGELEDQIRESLNEHLRIKI